MLPKTSINDVLITVEQDQYSFCR